MAEPNDTAPPLRNNQDERLPPGPPAEEARKGPQPGESVCLAVPGSPQMVVSEHLPNGDIRCRWFDKDRSLQEATFRAAELRPAGAKKGRKG